jgi:hypothetical protein
MFNPQEPNTNNFFEVVDEIRRLICVILIGCLFGLMMLLLIP